MIHHNLQQVGINPEYEGYSARLTRQKPELKDTKEDARLI
jgi:hypothetical protein